MMPRIESKPEKTAGSAQLNGGVAPAVPLDASWASSFMDEVRGLASLPRAWNGEDAEAPNAQSVQAGLQVLQVAQRMAFRPGRVAASVEGGIAVVFSRDGKYADVECLNSGAVLAVTSDRKTEPEAWEVGDNLPATLERIRDYLQS